MLHANKETRKQGNRDLERTYICIMDEMPHEGLRRLLYGIQHQRKGGRGVPRGEQLLDQEGVVQAAVLEGSIGHFWRMLREILLIRWFRTIMWGAYFSSAVVRDCHLDWWTGIR